jgi:hypothetical protein
MSASVYISQLEKPIRDIGPCVDLSSDDVLESIGLYDRNVSDVSRKRSMMTENENEKLLYRD